MERIVQLEENKYEKLIELASLNQDKIEEKAKDLWKREGISQLVVNTYINDKWSSEYKINCRSSIYAENDDFELDEKLKKEFSKYINEAVLYKMNQEYGKGVDMINKCNKRNEELDKQIRVINLITLSGWGAFIGCLMYLIFG